jgi:hypothetical protein
MLIEAWRASPAMDHGDMAIPRLRRLFVLLACSLALLFAVLGPEETRTLGFLAGYIYWLLHIGLGLGAAILAAMGLARWLPGRRSPALLDLVLAGVSGSLAFAPLALGLEQLFAIAATPDLAPDWIDRLEARGGIWALVAEWLQLAPPYLATWLCINVAAVPGALVPSVRGGGQLPATTCADDGPADASPPSLQHPTAPARPEKPGSPDPEPMVAATAIESATCESVIPASAALPMTASAPTGSTTTTAEEPATDAAQPFLALLPPAIGDDVIWIRADLHYLHVKTRRGQATVLGGLAAAEAALGVRGLRVHRSHWVALAHVRRISRGAYGWACRLSDGTRVPISRRRTGEVRRLLGLDFVIDDDPDLSDRDV